ncbi:MAG: hypothetical protein IT226_03815 [Flavobacteriales bacterium]|nr:hypothetical protein [Flavobacteriales bacterium]
MHRLSLVFSLVALLGVGVVFFQVSGMEQARNEQGSAPRAAEEPNGKPEHMEVAVYMGRLQRFHQKLWLAGNVGNAELAKFYLHEMEETMEAIADGHVVEQGVNVSAAMETHGLPAIGKLEDLLEKEGVGAMHANGGILVEGCNNCHVATEHAYIRIKEPEAAAFPDQYFAPVTK